MKFEKSDDMCVTFFSSQPTSAFPKGRRLAGLQTSEKCLHFSERVSTLSTPSKDFLFEKVRFFYQHAHQACCPKAVGFWVSGPDRVRAFRFAETGQGLSPCNLSGALPLHPA